MSDDIILRDYMRIAGERPCEEIIQSLLSKDGMYKEKIVYHDWLKDANEQPNEDITHGLFNEVSMSKPVPPRFERIYNADGTCHAANCEAPGLILAYDEFSPEVALWFCGMHWADCVGVEMLTVAEDLRKPLFPLFGWNYAAKEIGPGVYEHTFTSSTTRTTQEFPLIAGTYHDAVMAQPLATQDTLAEQSFWASLPGTKPPWHGYAWHCERVRERAEREQRKAQRARARYHRQHRAVFRRRKRGIA